MLLFHSCSAAFSSPCTGEHCYISAGAGQTTQCCMELTVFINDSFNRACLAQLHIFVLLLWHYFYSNTFNPLVKKCGLNTTKERHFFKKRHFSMLYPCYRSLVMCQICSIYLYMKEKGYFFSIFLLQCYTVHSTVALMHRDVKILWFRKCSAKGKGCQKARLSSKIY